MSQSIRLDSTRKLKPENKEKLEKLGFIIEDSDFVEIRSNMDRNKEQILATNISPLVITSQNALYAIENIVGELKQKEVFTIEGVTTTEARRLGFEIIGTARDTSGLIDAIVDFSPESILHVTSNIRRNELGRGLAEAHIPMQVLEVYEKIPRPRKIEQFDGILFWSPSQVDALLIENSLFPETLIFSIGNTTTTHLKRLRYQNIITIPESSEESMIATVIAHFTQQ